VVRTVRLLGLVLGLLAITAITSPWIALGLGTLGVEFKFSRVWRWWPGGADRHRAAPRVGTATAHGFAGDGARSYTRRLTTCGD
jgi:hypothetical protein